MGEGREGGGGCCLYVLLLYPGAEVLGASLNVETRNIVLSRSLLLAGGMDNNDNNPFAIDLVRTHNYLRRSLGVIMKK